jgi:hypothetical protein
MRKSIIRQRTTKLKSLLKDYEILVSLHKSLDKTLDVPIPEAKDLLANPAFPEGWKHPDGLSDNLIYCQRYELVYSYLSYIRALKRKEEAEASLQNYVHWLMDRRDALADLRKDLMGQHRGLPVYRDDRTDRFTFHPETESNLAAIHGFKQLLYDATLDNASRLRSTALLLQKCTSVLKFPSRGDDRGEQRTRKLLRRLTKDIRDENGSCDSDSLDTEESDHDEISESEAYESESKASSCEEEDD